jgi:aryl-alcohol dehydrogenase-like predicted oxidoreductase
MERRKLGSDGPDISVVGYGAWEAGGNMWGSNEDDRVVIEAMHAAIDAGMSWIDTAEIYGRGHSEELVGQALRDLDGDGDILVFTKFAPFASRSRPSDVVDALRGSLKRLGLDRVDLYQVHWADESAMPTEAIWEGMAEAQDQGLTRLIGVSNFDRSLIERCLAIRHVDCVQNQFSLLHQDDRAELLPWLQEKGIGYLAYGPLAFGLLTGALTPQTTFGKDDWRGGGLGIDYYEELFSPGAFEPQLERVERLRPIAERVGIELPLLALRAVIETPGMTAAIAGSRRAEHCRSNARAGEMRLTPEVLEEIQAALAE